MSTIPGDEYLAKLLKYLTTHKHRLTAPPFPSLPSPSAAGLPVGNIWQQSYTIATLGLDPTSSPLNPGLATVFSLGLAGTAGVPTVESTRAAQVKPLTLRLPPDRILYLLLLFQASSNTTLSTSPLIRPTDEPLPPGVSVLPSDYRDQGEGKEGDVQSVRSWVGSLRSVGGVFGGKKGKGEGWTGWFGGRKREEMDFDTKLRIIYTALTVLPSLCIPSITSREPRIEELERQGGYTRWGGVDVRVPLGVFRGLVSLELEGTDPRAVIIPVIPGLKALTVRDVTDGEDWLEELLSASEPDGPPSARFPSLQYLSLPNTSLFTFPLPEDYTPASVTHLDLSANVLNALPATLAQLPQLQSLNIRTNLLTSVRNAVKLVPRVRALNLRENKIDCLAGLDALRELQRVDIRHNSIHDVDELSRLAQLPDLREVWAQGNPFTAQDDDSQWRVRVFEAFVSEQGEDVLARLSVDGYLATWAERRAVMGSVKQRGRAGRERQDKARPARKTSVEEPRTPSSSRTSHDHTTHQPTATPSSKPRRKQRIVDLGESSDGPDLLVVDTSGVKGVEGVKRAVEDALESPIAPKVDATRAPSPVPNGKPATTERTAPIPPIASHDVDDAEPKEDLRKRMEALRSEVGDSWLSVLAGQARGSPSPVPSQSQLANAPKGNAESTLVVEQPEEVQVVQVKRKTAKGKKKNS